MLIGVLDSVWLQLSCARCVSSFRERQIHALKFGRLLLKLFQKNYLKLGTGATPRLSLFYMPYFLEKGVSMVLLKQEHSPYLMRDSKQISCNLHVPTRPWSTTLPIAALIPRPCLAAQLRARAEWTEACPASKIFNLFQLWIRPKTVQIDQKMGGFTRETFV
jgi:hypothetical protein